MKSTSLAAPTQQTSTTPIAWGFASCSTQRTAQLVRSAFHPKLTLAECLFFDQNRTSATSRESLVRLRQANNHPSFGQQKARQDRSRRALLVHPHSCAEALLRLLQFLPLNDIRQGGRTAG